MVRSLHPSVRFAARSHGGNVNYDVALQLSVGHVLKQLQGLLPLPTWRREINSQARVGGPKDGAMLRVVKSGG